MGESHIHQVRVTGFRALSSMVSSEQNRLLLSVPHPPSFCDKPSAQRITPHCPPLSPCTTQQDGCLSSSCFYFPSSLEAGRHLFLAVAWISRLSFYLTGHWGPKVSPREGAGSPIPFLDTEGKRKAAGLEACFAINDTDAHLAGGPRTCSQSFQKRSRDGCRALIASKLKCGLWAL